MYICLYEHPNLRDYNSWSQQIYNRQPAQFRVIVRLLFFTLQEPQFQKMLYFFYALSNPVHSYPLAPALLILIVLTHFFMLFSWSVVARTLLAFCLASSSFSVACCL